jgi:hypothetical protein
MSCTLWAQNNPASWQNLNYVRVGEKIQVVERNSTKISGMFLNISDGAISVQQEGGSQAIPRQDVVSVKLMKNRHRLLNTFIGAAIGAGARAAIATRRGTTTLLREAWSPRSWRGPFWCPARSSEPSCPTTQRFTAYVCTSCDFSKSDY